MTPEQEQRLKAERTSGWFSEFAAHTNQKAITAKTLEALLGNLRDTFSMPHLFHTNTPPTVLEIGTGNGVLSAQFKKLFDSMNVNGIKYTGIEYDPKFAIQTQHNIGNGNIIAREDGFLLDAEGIKNALQLGKNPDIIFASHSFMYSPDLEKTIDTVRDLMHKDSITIIISTSPDADHMTLTKGFSDVVGGTVDKQLSEGFKNRNMKQHVIPIEAKLTFPKIEAATWEELQEAPPYNAAVNPHTAQPEGLATRRMIEFVLQRPLEALDEKPRALYLEGIKDALFVQSDVLNVNNIIRITNAPNATRQAEHGLSKAVEKTNKAFNSKNRSL